MTRFILVRHGETTWNKEGRYQGLIDTPLSERGLDQGRKLAEALKHIPIDLCYSSPLSRSYDTAKMCMKWHGGLIETDNRGFINRPVHVVYKIMSEGFFE